MRKKTFVLSCVETVEENVAYSLVVKMDRGQYHGDSDFTISWPFPQKLSLPGTLPPPPCLFLDPLPSPPLPPTIPLSSTCLSPFLCLFVDPPLPTSLSSFYFLPFSSISILQVQKLSTPLEEDSIQPGGETLPLSGDKHSHIQGQTQTLPHPGTNTSPLALGGRQYPTRGETPPPHNTNTLGIGVWQTLPGTAGQTLRICIPSNR